jgi:putative aldouronate transport system permease protein
MEKRFLIFKKNRNKIKRSKKDVVFDIINYIFISLLVLIVLLPFLHLVSIGLSKPTDVVNGKVYFLPKNITFFAFEYTLKLKEFWRAAGVSIFVTVIGTIIGVIVTTLAAYPLSKPNFRARKPFLVFLLITMVFNIGMIPTYFSIVSLGLLDNIWALILPFVVNTYNVLLVKNYFETLPEALIESAKIDGASEFQIFLKIIIPLASPTLATIALFFAVSYWNAYIPGKFYIKTDALMPLQTYLTNFLIIDTNQPFDLPEAVLAIRTSGSFRASLIVLSTIPVGILYIFAQKYFVTGLVVGSEK